jgi:hypothetical protein
MAMPSKSAMQGQLNTMRGAASSRYVCAKVLERINEFDNFFVTIGWDIVEREYDRFPGLPLAGSHHKKERKRKTKNTLLSFVALLIHWVHSNCGATPTAAAPNGWVKKISTSGTIGANLERSQAYCYLWN